MSRYEPERRSWSNIFFTEHNSFDVTRPKKVRDISKFSFVLELQRLQDHIYPLIKKIGLLNYFFDYT